MTDDTPTYNREALAREGCPTWEGAARGLGARVDSVDAHQPDALPVCVSLGGVLVCPE